MEKIASAISGLTYMTDFITLGIKCLFKFLKLDEQKTIVEELDGNLKENWAVDLKRRVQQYGYKYAFSLLFSKKKIHAQRSRYRHEESCTSYSIYFIANNEKVTFSNFPCNGLRLVDMKFFPKLPDQVIINEYEPGEHQIYVTRRARNQPTCRQNSLL